MANHSVEVALPLAEILNKNAEFIIRSNGQQLGRLTVSRGGIGWFPRKTKQERHFTWEHFDQLVRECEGR